MTLVADAHSDLLLELAYRERLERPFERLWLDQLRAGGVGLQVCAIWVHPRYGPEASLRVALKQVVACHRAAAESSDVRLVTGDMSLSALRDGEIGLVLAMEGCEPLGRDHRLAEVFWRLGVRIFGLTWMRANAFAGGDLDDPDIGLTPEGMQLVASLIERGAIIDLAHSSERTYWDVLARGPQGVMVSHAGCRALHDVTRNVTDHQLEALRHREGVFGVMAHPLAFGRPNVDIGTIVDHVRHATGVMGAERVVIGGDFARQLARSGALENSPEEMCLEGGLRLDDVVAGFEGPADYPRLEEALVAAGMGAEAPHVLGLNLARFLGRCLPAESVTRSERR